MRLNSITKLFFYPLLAFLLFFNGCMTMGWDGINGTSEQKSGQNQLLIKERQVNGYSIFAEFPSAAVGKDILYALEIVGPETTLENNINSVYLYINEKDRVNAEKVSIRLSPDASLSSSTRFVFPYRFDETGMYEASFIIETVSEGNTVSSFTVSENYSITESYTDNHHSNNLAPWIWGGGAMMTGMMLWMILH